MSGIGTVPSPKSIVRASERMSFRANRSTERSSFILLDMYLIAKASPHSIESSLSKRVQKALHRLNSDDVETDSNINGKPRLKKSKKDDVAKKRANDKTDELDDT